MVQDARLTLIFSMFGQYYACIWQFHVAPFELWVILFAVGSNDVKQDQMQAKMHLYMHISVYIQAFNNK